MKATPSTIILYVTILFKLAQAASAPLALFPHPEFRGGSVIFFATSDVGNSLQTFALTYSSDLSNTGLILVQPIIGVFSIEFSMQSFELDFQVAASPTSFTSTGFTTDFTIDRSRLARFAVVFLAARVPTKSFYYVHHFQDITSYVGPTTITGTASTGLTTHPVSVQVISFLYTLHLLSTTFETFKLDSSIIFTQPSTIAYTIVVPNGYTVNKIRMTGLIIDQTTFLAHLPYGGFVQAGTLSSTSNFIIDNRFTNAFIESLIIGLCDFQYTFSQMIVDSNVNVNEFVMLSQSFMLIQFSYLIIKYFACPSATPYYKAFDSLCYDDCGAKFFNQVSTMSCQACLYRCEDCLSFGTCSSCDSSDNRQKIGNDCVPKPGFFQSGVQIASPCQSPCFNCQTTNRTCLSCVDDTYYFDSINNDCILCGLQFSDCARCTTVCTACDIGFVLIGLTCTQCDLGCAQCQFNASYCHSCNSRSGYAWKNFACYNPCPARTFLSLNLTNCTDCNLQCTQCQTSASNCLSCDTALGYAWNNFVCYNPCPNKTFLSLNQENCSECEPQCLSCQFNSSYCYSCDKNLGFAWNNFICYSNCPTGTLLSENLENCTQCEGKGPDCVKQQSNLGYILAGVSIPAAVIIGAALVIKIMRYRSPIGQQTIVQSLPRNMTSQNFNNLQTGINQKYQKENGISVMPKKNDTINNLAYIIPLADPDSMSELSDGQRTFQKVAFMKKDRRQKQLKLPISNFEQQPYDKQSCNWEIVQINSQNQGGLTIQTNNKQSKQRLRKITIQKTQQSKNYSNFKWDLVAQLNQDRLILQK